MIVEVFRVLSENSTTAALHVPGRTNETYMFSDTLFFVGGTRARLSDFRSGNLFVILGWQTGTTPSHILQATGKSSCPTRCLTVEGR